jgi:TM2 domain-containing membrane protein YozV
MLIYDGFRMKRFVNLANSHADVRKANCMQLADIYQFWCYPWGIWGFHHLYMRNYWQFFIYLFTFGGFGAGWALDLCRIKNQYWPEIMRNGPRPPFWVKSGYSERNKSDMFWSWLPFGGWIGLHHFYSGDIFLGMCYFMSFGLWGIGWIVDCCRLSSWVDRFNKGIAKQVEEIRTRRLQEAAQQRNVKVGEEALAEATGLEDDEKMSVPSVVTDGSAPAAGMDHAEMAAIYKQVRRPKFAKSNFDGYLTWLASMGYLGMHHLYLQDFTLFFLHIVSLGGCGIMWIADLFLMPWFVDRANAKLGFSTPDDVPEMITEVATRIDRTIGEDDSERRAQKKRSLYICYLLWCPMYGFIGLYYLYLGKYKSFLVRFLTMNFFFVGWIIDACRMPALVNKFHEEQEAELHSSNAVFISHVDQPDNMNTTGAEQGLRQRGV